MTAQRVQAAPVAARAWWVAAVAGVTIVAAGAFTTVPGLLVDPLNRDFGWSRSSISVAVAVNMVLYGVTAPFAAALMDRFGIRRVVTAALALIALGAGLTTVMTAAWQLTLYWGLLVGLGCGSLTMTFAVTVTNAWFVKRRGLVTGALTGASHLGQLAFLPVLAWVVEDKGWRLAPIVLCLAAAVVLALVWLLLRDHPADLGRKPYGAEEFEPKPPPARGSAGRAVTVLGRSARGGRFWLIAATFAICGASTNGIMWSHFAPAAHDHGMPMTVAAGLLTAIGVCSATGTVISGWLTDRVDARLLLFGYYALRAIALFLLPSTLAPTVAPSMVVWVVVYGLIDVATVPPTIHICRQLYGNDSPVVFGWVNAAHQLGAGAMALVAGMLRDSLGSYDAMGYSAAALCVGAAGIALTLTTSTTPREQPPTGSKAGPVHEKSGARSTDRV
ncbi:MFS transporter [Actinokineospora iranica]|uniref:Predicted arabinose efflux permease, MFS family n=1 Tax=Actinokineospora iranica TaxID=1271860 RepID=A0A1G6JN03_9PSEU|nr:MFS transporter [Actinokineospora iranica]SDC20114.1 Predicted arabinose efflux permease, MFS family [Actinokineospora iranica]